MSILERDFGAIRGANLGRISELAKDLQQLESDLRKEMSDAYERGLIEEPLSMIKFIRDKILEGRPNFPIDSLNLTIRKFLFEKVSERNRRNADSMTDFFQEFRNSEMLFRHSFIDDCTGQLPGHGTYVTNPPTFGSDCRPTSAFHEFRVRRNEELKWIREVLGIDFRP